MPTKFLKQALARRRRGDVAILSVRLEDGDAVSPASVGVALGAVDVGGIVGAAVGAAAVGGKDGDAVGSRDGGLDGAPVVGAGLGCGPVGAADS